MVPALPDAPLRFSTGDHAPALRLKAWNEGFGRLLARRNLLPTRSDGRFRLTMRGYRLGIGDAGRTEGSVMRIAVTSGGKALRTPQMLSDGDDNVVLHVQESGNRVVEHLGREGMAGPGAGLLTSNADASAIALIGPARFVCIALPRRPMKALVPGLEDAFLRTMPPDTGILRLLIGYLGILDDSHMLATPALRRAVAAHIQDLCALAVGASRDAAEIARGRGLAAARLRAIKEDLACNLCIANCSAAALALRHGVTPRYIHKLFEREGATLSRYVRGQRLALAHRMLTDARFADLTIAAIAYDTGFTDLSTFNRAFRRHFGATPSDVRADGLKAR